MKLKAHIMRRLVRLIPAVLIAGAASAPSYAGNAADINPKLAPYAHIPGAEKISLKLLQAGETAKTKGKKAALDALGAKHIHGGQTAKGDQTLGLELICTDVNNQLLKSIKLLGATVVDSYPEYGRVIVEVSDLSIINKLAGLEQVVMVEPQWKPLTREFSGEVDSRADYALQSSTGSPRNDRENPLNVDGRGVTIGILSDSFARTEDMRTSSTFPGPGLSGNLVNAPSQLSGDLPASVHILRDDIVGGDEGAAMAELIHDIAPKASLAFHTAFQSEAGFAKGIELLYQSKQKGGGGANILVDDVGFFREPFYQDGLIAQAAAKAVKKGIPFFSAAGNSGDVGITSNFVDVNPAQDENQYQEDAFLGRDLHDWGNGNAFLPIYIPPTAGGARIILQWNQPFASLNPKKKRGGSQVDLDMYLLSSADNAALGSPVASSVDGQGTPVMPLNDPVEIIQYQGGGGTLFLAIDHVAGPKNTIPQGGKLEFRVIIDSLGADPLQVQGFGLGSNNEQGGGPTIWGHSLAAGVVSVAAVPWWESPAFDVESDTTWESFSVEPPYPPTNGLIDPEIFSSRGGNITMQFNAKGKRIKKGRSVLAPTLTAVDGNNTSFFYAPDEDLPQFIIQDDDPVTSHNGFDCEPDHHPNFFGTSAAAPNAAAVAALLMQVRPEIKPAELTKVLSDTAIDVTGYRAGAGWDDVSGAGLINAKAALAQLNKIIPAQDPRSNDCDPGDGGEGPGGGTPQDVNLVSDSINGASDATVPQIIIATTTGATADTGSYSAADNLFLSYAVRNLGPAATGLTFRIRASVDGVPVTTSTVNGLAVAKRDFVDLPIGRFTPGNHTVTVTVDSNNNIGETNETDNTVTQEITVNPIAGDNFSDLIVIDESIASGCYDPCLGHVFGSNLGATRGPAPEDDGTTAGATVWFQYNAEAKGIPYLVTFDTAGSEFDTMVDAYISFSGTPGPGNLVKIASNDNIIGGSAAFVQSQLTVSIPASGRTIYLSVGGANDAQGDIRLNWACEGVRLRDHYSSRSAMTTETLVSDLDTNKSATPEPSEPNLLTPFTAEYQKSNWYSFTVTGDELPLNQDNRPIRVSVVELSDPVYADADKPRFDPVIQVYTGSSLDALSLYAVGVDESGGFDDTEDFNPANPRVAEVTFVGFLGQAYEIQVDGLPLSCDPGTASAGRYRLEIEQLQNQ